MDNVQLQEMLRDEDIRTVHHLATISDDSNGMVEEETCSYHHSQEIKSDDPVIDILNYKEYISGTPLQDQRWLIEGWLGQSSLVVFSGTSKSGKSTMLTSIAKEIATGGKFLGKDCTKSNVLWLALEESRSERADILRLHDPIDGNLYTSHFPFRIDDRNHMKLLRELIAEKSIGLVIIDPLYLATKALTLNDGRAARDAVQPIKDLTNETEATVILIHHFTKNVGAGLVRERAADSNQLLALASMDVIMDVKPSATGVRQIYLKGAGRGRQSNFEWHVESKSETEFELIKEGSPGTVLGTVHADLIVNHLKSLAGKKQSAEQIASAIGDPVGSVRNRLTELKKEAKIKSQKTGKANEYWI